MEGFFICVHAGANGWSVASLPLFQLGSFSLPDPKKVFLG